MRPNPRISLIISAVVILSCGYSPSIAQYFGKNKVQYEDLDFKVYQTPHFDIYHYLDDDDYRETLGKLSERWYRRHQAIMLDTFDRRNPMIIYNNQADFKQTTVVRQQISVGLGGVTEGIRNRVVMPITASNTETSHVLGHEMVHAFQYHMAKTNDSIGIRSLSNIPLWLIEGAAEYMSIGPSSVHTAIWMRDAVLNDDIPSFDDLTRNPNDYFPYRYGHAVWAFLTGVWGDGIIKPLHIMSAKRGFANALDSLTGYQADTISRMWARALREYYEPLMEDTIGVVGRKILDVETAGEINLAPVLSPDGKYFTFISDKNVISIDVFLANAETGEVISRLTRAIRASHIDDYSYLESAGAWSPDSKKFAITTFAEGENKLVIIDVEKNKREKIIGIPGLEAFQNPDWSPDGSKIVVTGLMSGQSDLYVYNLETEEVRQLTDDQYSDLHPTWSPDGQTIAFASDRGPQTNLRVDNYGTYQISIYDFNSGSVENLKLFPGANTLNPQFGPGGSNLYFLSSADGFRNLYEYNLQSQELNKLTKYATGIVGITEYSPVLSIAGDQAVYTVYDDNNYLMYRASLSDFPRFSQDPGEADMTAARLPPIDRNPVNVVSRNLERTQDVAETAFELKPYQPRFSLEMVGSSGVGVGGSQFGTYYAGGVSLLFSDILRRNQLYTLLRVNGELEDIGGQAAYVNTANRISWGASISHIPYRSSGALVRLDTITRDDQEIVTRNLVQLVQRTFLDQASLFAQYPLSTNLRFEAGASFSRYSYSLDSINHYYTLGGTKFDEVEVELDAPDPNNIGNAYIAFVGDNSVMGLTSPLMGSRYRLEVERNFADVDLWNFLADFRRYWFFQPFSFAVRGIYYGRYGDGGGLLYPLFIGNHYFVRGYSVGAFRNNQCPGDDCLSINQLVGNKMAVVNAELRFPFTGPERLAMIKSGFLFSDLVLFADGGIAWNDIENLELSWDANDENERIPVFSAGLALRLNLFGYFILEPYLAFPFQRESVQSQLSLYISPGGW